MFRLFKTFYESLTSDLSVVSQSGVSVNVATPHGRPAIVTGAFTTNHSNVQFNGFDNKTLSLTEVSASVLFVGCYSDQLLLVVNGTGVISFNTSVGAITLNGKPLPGGWHWVEARIERIGAGTSYTLQVRIDGEEFVNQAFATATGNALWAARPFTVGVQQSGNSQPGRATDLCVWDDVNDGSGVTTWMGPMQVSAVRPSGNGASNQWLGSDGNSADNYLLVDETPASTSDYVESSVDGQRDLYSQSGLAPGLKPLAVKSMTYAQKNGSGLRSFKPVLKQNATVIVDTERTLSASPALFASTIQGKNPETNLPWTAAEIAALQFGVETSTPPA